MFTFKNFNHHQLHSSGHGWEFCSRISTGHDSRGVYSTRQTIYTPLFTPRGCPHLTTAAECGEGLQRGAMGEVEPPQVGAGGERIKMDSDWVVGKAEHLQNKRHEACLLS